MSGGVDEVEMPRVARNSLQWDIYSVFERTTLGLALVSGKMRGKRTEACSCLHSVVSIWEEDVVDIQKSYRHMEVHNTSSTYYIDATVQPSSEASRVGALSRGYGASWGFLSKIIFKSLIWVLSLFSSSSIGLFCC